MGGGREGEISLSLSLCKWTKIFCMAADPKCASVRCFEGYSRTDWIAMSRTPFSSSRKTSDSRTPFSHNGKNHTTPFSSRKKSQSSCSRFIPSRSTTDKDLAHHQFQNVDEKSTSEEKDQLAKCLFATEDPGKTKILSFKQKAPMPKLASSEEQMREVYSRNKSLHQKPKKARYISSMPEKILDAPDLLDDYYLNLLDWSVDNLLAVGLGSSVYLWNASNGEIDCLLDTEDPENHITSVSWLQTGTHIAIGTSRREVQIWDIKKQKQLRKFTDHSSRVGSLCWNRHILTSGSRDAEIHNHDVRIADHLINRWNYHEQEVCGLKWSPLEGGKQLASGGNDNNCCIWELGYDEPIHVLNEHQAAVKALAWSPHQPNLLATGGGTADRHIRFWNTSLGNSISAIDTKSQVCSLIWNPYEKELLSSHGFSQNQLTLWKYPSMVGCADLTGHTSRVLHTALSPDGTTVCSAAADETLRFWKVFEPVSKKPKARSGKADGPNRGLEELKIR